MRKKLSILFISIYLLGVVVLMFLYKGGSYYYPGQHSYVFHENYLSDLGRRFYFDGTPNDIWWLYSVILSFAGLGSFLFFMEMSQGLERGKRAVVLFFALLSTGGFIGIALFPADTHLKYHLIAGGIAFFSFFIAFALLFLFRKPENSRKENFLFALLFLILVFYLTVDFFAPSSRKNEQALILKVVAQKIIVGAQLLIAVFLLLSEGREVRENLS